MEEKNLEDQMQEFEKRAEEYEEEKVGGIHISSEDSQPQPQQETEPVQLKKLSVNDLKSGLLPPEGTLIRINQYVYKVTYQNVGKLRFSAEFQEALIPSEVVDPNTNQPTMLRKTFEDIKQEVKDIGRLAD